MRKAQPHAQERVDDLVKIKKALRGRRTQSGGNRLHDAGLDPKSPKDIGFKAQLGQLLKRIDQSQVAIEFKTIEYMRRVRHADVFWTQVAVAFPDPALRGARFVLGQELLETGLICREQGSKPWMVIFKKRMEKHTPVQAVLTFLNGCEFSCCEIGAGGSLIERCQLFGHAIDAMAQPVFI